MERNLYQNFNQIMPRSFLGRYMHDLLQARWLAISHLVEGDAPSAL